MSVNEVYDLVVLLVSKVNTHSCETVSANVDEVPQGLGLVRLGFRFHGVNLTELSFQRSFSARGSTASVAVKVWPTGKAKVSDDVRRYWVAGRS